MRLNEFSEDEEPPKDENPTPKTSKELEDATLAMHRAYLVVDTLLRNMSNDK